MALTCKLSELVDQIQRSTIPEWVKDGVRDHKEEIISRLQTGGEWIIPNPNGLEFLTIWKTVSWWTRFKNLFTK